MRQFMGLALGSRAVLEVQYDHGVGLVAAAATPQEGSQATEGQSANEREDQQYPN